MSTERPDINALIRDIHETARSKGWHERKRNWGEARMAIRSELAEAWEEFRCGRTATWEGAGESGKAKPEGFGIELADAWIRRADYAGLIGEELGPAREDLAFSDFPVWCDDPRNVSEQLDWLCESTEDIAEFTSCCLAVAKANGVDFWECVKVKMAYNLTRSYRHGGRLA